MDNFFFQKHKIILVSLQSTYQLWRKNYHLREQEVPIWKLLRDPKVYLDLNVLWFQQNAWIETKGFTWTYELLNCNISSVQSLSCVRLFVTPWTAAHQASLSITSQCASQGFKTMWKNSARGWSLNWPLSVQVCDPHQGFNHQSMQSDW